MTLRFGSGLVAAISLLFSVTHAAEAAECKFANPHKLNGIVASKDKMSDNQFTYWQVKFKSDTLVCEPRYFFDGVSGGYTTRDVLLVGGGVTDLSSLLIGRHLRVSGKYVSIKSSPHFGDPTWYMAKFVVTGVEHR